MLVIEAATLMCHLDLTYDGAGRILNIQQTLGANVENYGHQFDGNGRLETITGPGFTTQLGYESATGRLLTETRTGQGAYSYTYGFDNNDNRVSQVGTSPTGPVNKTFRYNGLNQLIFINPGPNQTQYFYDDAGNRTTEQYPDGTQVTNGFDRLNRLTGVTSTNGTNSATSVYSYAGPSWMRTNATVNGVSTDFYYDGYALVGSKSNGASTAYMVPGTEQLWETNPNGTFTYTKDGQRNVTGLWDVTNAAYNSMFSYDQYGNVSTTDGNGNPIANTSGLRYRGEFFNAAINKTFLRYRDYDSTTGTFMSMDPSEQEQNAYLYAASDTANNIDPMGTEWVYFTRKKKKIELKPDELAIWNATTEKGTDNDIDWGWREDGTERPGLRPTPEEIKIAKANIGDADVYPTLAMLAKEQKNAVRSAIIHSAPAVVQQTREGITKAAWTPVEGLAWATGEAAMAKLFNWGLKALEGTKVVKGAGETEVILDEVAAGARVPGEKFKDFAKLRADLANKGIDLVEDASSELPDKVAARFSVVADKAGNVKGVMKLRPGATNYEVWHELAHAEHFSQTGYQFINKMSAVEKELQTFATLYRKYWSRLNPEEQKDAVRYVKKFIEDAGGDPKQIDGIVNGQ